MRISDWSSDVCSSDLLGLPTPDIVIEDDTDLIARKELEKARQMPMIKPVFKKAGNARFRPEEIPRGISTHRAATVKHAIVGIGAVDGIAQLHDQLGVRQSLGDPARRFWVSKIIGRFLTHDLPVAQDRKSVV